MSIISGFVSVSFPLRFAIELTVVLAPTPSAIAHTIVDFPVPLGPMTILRCGPGCMTTCVYVTKFVRMIRRMEPGT